MNKISLVLTILLLFIFSFGVESGILDEITPELEKSVHSKLGCDVCHEFDRSTAEVDIATVDCSGCHQEETESYEQSLHRSGKEIAPEEVPDCFDCHGDHRILAVDDPGSVTSHRNAVAVCIRCHEDENKREQFEILPEPQMIVAYENSVHGRALLVEGNDDAPSCVDCHGSHSLLPPDKSDSPLYKGQIATTCGNCHEEIAAHYKESVHGMALKQGIMESPTCTDCHGEHNIKAHLDPESMVYSGNIPKTCSACHTSEKVVAKYGLKPDRIETYKESFHGIAVELEETKAANCASCHGVHDIFAQDDSRSWINSSRIEETCGQCHDDLPEDFAQGQVHTSAKDIESGGKYYVRKFYYWFIPVLVIGFILYRIMEYKRRSQRVEK